MSAERLAIGDLVRCQRCRQWHPTEQPESGSATDYATQMLFYRCGRALFYAGQIGSTARDPNAVKSPLELELWRVTWNTQTIACELRCDADGWDVLLRSNGEALFSRRCGSEDEARYCAHGLHQDHLNHGWTCGRCRGERWICEQHPDLAWPHEDCAGPGLPCPSCNTKEPPDRPPGFRTVANVED